MVVASLILGSLLVAACGSDTVSEGDGADSTAASDDLLQIGAEVYAAMCASCHGDEGQGGAGPGFEGVAERYPEVADHIEVVVSGIGLMPGFGGVLDDTEVEAVVAYERDVLDSG